MYIYIVLIYIYSQVPPSWVLLQVTWYILICLLRSCCLTLTLTVTVSVKVSSLQLQPSKSNLAIFVSIMLNSQPPNFSVLMFLKKKIHLSSHLVNMFWWLGCPGTCWLYPLQLVLPVPYVTMCAILTDFDMFFPVYCWDGFHSKYCCHFCRMLMGGFSLFQA